MTDRAIIGVVDDDVDERELVVRSLARALKDLVAKGDVDKKQGWRVRGFAPPENLADLNELVLDEGILVLLVDERLDGRIVGDQVRPVRKSVAYRGSEAVKFLAPRAWDLPLYLFSGIPGDESIDRVRTRVRKVIARGELKKRSEAPSYVSEFVREGQRYRLGTLRRHARLGELADKAARGQLTRQESDEAEAIRRELLLAVDAELSAAPEVANKRAVLLDRLDESLERLEKSLAAVESGARMDSKHKKAR